MEREREREHKKAEGGRWMTLCEKQQDGENNNKEREGKRPREEEDC